MEELQKLALENGLIDENGNPTEMAIREGLLLMEVGENTVS